jgi:MFS family permease
MDQVPLENVALLKKICLVWGLVVSSWAILGASVPLILKDAVGSVEAAQWQGIFTATTALSGMTFCMLLGYHSDRLGRLQMLLPWITCFFLATVCVLYAQLWQNVYLLLVARLAAISIPSAILYAFTSDLVKGPAILVAHGYLGATFGASLLIGSVACAVVGSYSRFVVLSVACALAACSAFVAGTTGFVHTVGIPFGSFGETIAAVRRDPLLSLLVLAFALTRVCNVNSYFMFVIFTNYRLGWEIFHTSIMLGIMGGVGVFLQLFGTRFVMHSKISAFYWLQLCCLSSCFAMIGYGSVASTEGMYLVGIFGTLGGIGGSIFTAKITALSTEDGIAGTTMGLVGSIQNFVEIFFALGFGKLLSWSIATYEPKDLLLGIPYFVNGALYFLVFLLVVFAHRKHGMHRAVWMKQQPSSEEEDTELPPRFT